MKSHIQIPKSILKNFENDNKELFYYDFQDKKVKKGHAKTLYCKENYYSSTTEKFLSDEVETSLGRLLKYLSEATFEEGESPLSDYEDIAFNYLYSLISRSPSILNTINEFSCFYQVLPEQNRHDYTARNAFLLAREKGLLRDYQVGFLCNKASEELMLPSGGVTWYMNLLICPVSRDKAIIFKKEKDEITNSDKYEVSIYETESDDVVHGINVASYVQEKERETRYFIGSRKESIFQYIH